LENRVFSALDVIHLLFALARFEQLVERNAVGRRFDGLLQLTPSIAQFDRAIRVAERRRIEHLPMHRAENVPQSNFRWRTRQPLTAFFPALAFDNLLGLQLNENLDEVTRGNSLFGRQVFDAHGDTRLVLAGQTQNSASGIIALHGKLHSQKLGRCHCFRNKNSRPALPPDEKRGTRMRRFKIQPRRGVAPSYHRIELLPTNHELHTFAFPFHQRT